MEILVQRFNYSENSVIGRLALDGSHFCFTLERPWKNNQHEVSCILPGRYPVTIRYSPHWNAPMPHVENVPGRSEIMLHPANWVSQLLGCIAPGETYGQDCINESRAAFAPLFGRIKDAFERGEPVWLLVVGDGREVAA